MISLKQVKDALAGPVAPVSTLFNRDGSIDFKGLRNIIDFNFTHPWRHGGFRRYSKIAENSLYERK